MLQALPKGSTKVHTARVFQDGDHVFPHTEYDFFGPKIGSDIFHFVNGKIIKHGDNLQAKPTTRTPSGRSVIDEPTTAEDLDKTQANKTLVAAFVDDILIHDRLERLAGYFDGDHYLQHNPQVGSGASDHGACRFGPSLPHRTQAILGEGNDATRPDARLCAQELHDSIEQPARVRAQSGRRAAKASRPG
ncbi:hypothetical protein [Xanthomonas albilineans]|uniref:hypothetical protein n=1 Tax=Xanthomonas albilineans TaxID=29447 RepID=UPI000698854F|nr:hypothetical protein [Xanthomonas albilineans]